MTVINYVNIKNIEKQLETIKSAYEAKNTLYLSSLNKPVMQNFITNTVSAKVTVYSFSDELKNSIIINSNSYNFGSVTEDILFDIEIYNNSANSYTIDNINIVNLSGLDVSLTTLNLGPYKSNTMKVSISSSGESVNDGYIEVVINSVSYFILINYQREAVFSYMIDRSNEVTYVYSFLTEINKSLSGKEKRKAKMINPRLNVDYGYIQTKADRRKFENEIITNNYSSLYMPIWAEKFDATHVDNKIYGDYRHTSIDVNSSIFAWEFDKSQILKVIDINDNYIEVEKINQNFNKFYIYPLFKTRIADNVVESKVSRDIGTFIIPFDAEEDLNPNLLNNRYNFNYTQINGLPFYDFLVHNTTGQSQKTFNKSVVVLDNNISKRSRFVNFSISEMTLDIQMNLFEKVEITKIKDIFNRSTACLESFYFLKNDSDVEVLENIDKNSTIITIRDNNSSVLFENKVFEYIYILHNSQIPIILKVNEVRKAGNNTEVLLTESLPVDVDIKSIRLVSYIQKGRFNQDSLSIAYKSNNIASVSLSIKNINGKE